MGTKFKGSTGGEKHRTDRFNKIPRGQGLAPKYRARAHACSTDCACDGPGRAEHKAKLARRGARAEARP